LGIIAHNYVQQKKHLIHYFVAHLCATHGVFCTYEKLPDPSAPKKKFPLIQRDSRRCAFKVLSGAQGGMAGLLRSLAAPRLLHQRSPPASILVAPARPKDDCQFTQIHLSCVFDRPDRTFIEWAMGHVTFPDYDREIKTTFLQKENSRSSQSVSRRVVLGSDHPTTRLLDRDMVQRLPMAIKF
jgi:hypothetical protein